MTMDQINTRLEELRDEKTKIKGIETEVYARIVGYYRSVRNWNKGKKEEYGKRTNFGDIRVKPAQAGADDSPSENVLSLVNREKQQHLSFAQTLGRPAAAVSYLYFYRKACPNCPPVAAWLKQTGIEGRGIDVDRESGMLEAARYDITAAPTVILLDVQGQEAGRGSNVAALELELGITAAAGA